VVRALSLLKNRLPADYEVIFMLFGIRRFIGRMQGLIRHESGQDLVEYALLIALIAFGATAGMGKLATGIKTAFSNISVQLSTNVT